MNLVRGLGGLLTAALPQRCLSILIFHRVLERPDPLFPEEPDTARFDKILGWVKRSFNVLPLDHAVQALQHGDLSARALAITFDDGYADNYTLAVPLLQRHGLHATFFVASGFLNGGRMWNDSLIEAVRGTTAERLDLTDEGLGTHSLATLSERRRAIECLLPQVKYRPPVQREAVVKWVAQRCGASLPNDLMMTNQQLQALHRAGMGVGGHTLSHPILARVDDDDARVEIIGNKQFLESLLGLPMTLFAYPNGKPDSDYGKRHTAMAREAGYAAAVTTSPGVARPGADPMQLPRFTPWDRHALRFGLRMVGNMRHAGRLAT
jgi:peptidoglycan/xylan/chitin deacetylase (PgdA/CDA1 family)